MSRLFDGVSVSRTLEFGFNWLDCGNPASEDGTHVYEWTNYGPPAIIERFEVQNGTTIGSATAGVVTLSTTNVDYAVTLPGGTTITPLGYGYINAFAEDVIATDETLFVTITTAATSAKEARGRITLRSAA